MASLPRSWKLALALCALETYASAFSALSPFYPHLGGLGAPLREQLAARAGDGFGAVAPLLRAVLAQHPAGAVSLIAGACLAHLTCYAACVLFMVRLVSGRGGGSCGVLRALLLASLPKLLLLPSMAWPYTRGLTTGIAAYTLASHAVALHCVLPMGTSLSSAVGVIALAAAASAALAAALARQEAW